MGNMQSFPPVLDNRCVDPGQNSGDVVNGCYADGQAGGTNDNTFCQRRGGTYPLPPGGGFKTPGGAVYPEPEWEFGGYNNVCTYDDCNNGNLAVGDLAGGGGCNGKCCAISTAITGGGTYSCTKTANLGDPLSCCLRDFQCSSDTNQTSKACFSDDNTNSTCPADFRASDTSACTSMLTQLCLGNLSTAIGLNLNDVDFTALWTDATNPSTGQNWTVNGLPSGSLYQTSKDIFNNPSIPCVLNKDGTFSGTCTTSTWELGKPGAPTQYLPIPSLYEFSGLPPCQKLFWRTLYGNQPVFTNNLWTTNNVSNNSSSEATPATSIQPQLASCGAIPFGGTPTPGGFEKAEYMLSAAVNKFISEGGSITASITTVKDAPFLSWLFSVCSAYPSLCSSGPGSSGVGNKFLDNVCSTATGEQLQTNPELLKWCGCYMPDSEYTVYGNITDSVISRECTPYCNASGVVPSFDPSTGQIKTCTQSLCVIDDVTLTIAKSRVNGPINFNNICTACSPDSGNGVNSNLVSNSNNGNTNTDSESNSTINVSSSCQCIINNFNLTTIGATIDGGINISQACNGNAKCFRTETVNGVQQTQEVDCHSNNLSSNNVLELEERKLMKKAEDTGSYWVIFIIVITVLIIILLWILLGPRGVPTKDITFTKTVNIEVPKQSVMSPPMNILPMSLQYNTSVPSKAKYF